ncbi:MAG: DNA cytosine methyltransferase [Thermoplasmatota archaeon]
MLRRALRPPSTPLRGIAAVDIFCGAGGLTNGLRSAGINVLAGYDIDPACRYPFEKNNPPAKFFERDIRTLDSGDVSRLFPSAHARALVGCAPCTPFSALRKGADTSNEQEFALLTEFSRLVHRVQPELVSVENVPQIRRHEIFTEFLDSLHDAGYSVSVNVIDCESYGVPQKRKRMVLLASRFGPIRLVRPTHVGRELTVRDAIGGLPPIAAGEQDARDKLHWAPRLSKTNLRRIQHSKPGGTWRDWPRHYRLDCHKKPGGKSYTEVYGRMRWSTPASTITTKFYNLGSGRFGHPSQDRALSLREAAILQTFPRRYAFATKGVLRTQIGTLIGNAVPPRLGAAVGASLWHHVAATPSGAALHGPARGWGKPLKAEAATEKWAARRDSRAACVQRDTQDAAALPGDVMR